MKQYRDKGMPSFTEGNKVDVRNLANILVAISSVTKQFADELMVYTHDGSGSDGCCAKCVYRTRNSRRAG